MKMPWDKFLRRKSITETELKEDYPTDLESDISEDDRTRISDDDRRRVGAWSRSPEAHPRDTGKESDWEYFSEYNVSFSSDNSIIDAYREHGRRFQTTSRHDDREFEDVFKQAIQEETSYNDRRRMETKKNQYLSPPRIDVNQGSASPCSNRSRVPPPKVRDKIQAFEQSVAGKRRASCFPTTSEKMTDHQTGNRYGTWNTPTKKRQRKLPKHRRRAGDNSPDDSDDESKYTVNLSLDELNDIIKRNVSSAMKTIASSTGRGRMQGLVPISPSESFSTETETMFSGSSSHSTELPPGVLNKQIKAQLDKDLLRGHRKMSLVPGLVSELDGGRRAPTINVPNFSPHQTVNTISDSSPFGNVQQHQQQTFRNVQNQVFANPQQPQHSLFTGTQLTEASLPPYLNLITGTTPAAPPAPPPPSSLHHVTFNVPGAGAGSYHGYDQNQHRPSLETYEQDLMSSLGSGIPQAALGRLQSRRHTLASLGNEQLLSGLNDNFESKLEQVSKAIRLLDNNINLEDSARSSQQYSTQSGQGTDNGQAKTETKAEPIESAQNTVTTTNAGHVPFSPQSNVLAPVMSIADQIKALSKKPKKELKPGQIDMAGWARALLIVTNVVFLVCLNLPCVYRIFFLLHF